LLSLAALWRADRGGAIEALCASLLSGVLVWRVLGAWRRDTPVVELRERRLLLDDAPVELATAWLGPYWVVVRGRSGGRRVRLSVHAWEIDKTTFARLRAHCVDVLPRVTRLRVGARRARR
jgi:hypothetical protein